LAASGWHDFTSTVSADFSDKLTVTDATHTADSFTKTETCSASSCVDSSAEWIAEAPTNASSLRPPRHRAKCQAMPPGISYVPQPAAATAAGAWSIAQSTC
jgi:hypothetical protein